MESTLAFLGWPPVCGSLVFLGVAALLTGRSAVLRAAFVLLGALWLVYAVAHWGPPAGWLWLLTATAESVGLVVLAASPATRPENRRESGPRPVASGSLLAVAALAAVAPWLGLPRFDGVADASGLPWLELLTLGFLLGSRRRRGHLAIAAALPPMLSLGTCRFGLLAGGPWLQGLWLAGFALGLPALFPNPRLRPENEGPAEVTDGRDRLKCDSVPGWLAWAGLGASLGAGLLLLGNPRIATLTEPTTEALRQAAASGLVLALAAAGSSLRFSAWTSPAFRHLAWRAAHTLGVFRAWLRVGLHGWVLAGATTGAALGVIVAGYPELRKGEFWSALTQAPGEELVVPAALATLFGLGVAIFRARRRIFVEDFTWEKPAGGEVSGAALAACLRHELAAITVVHRTIDEALPTSDGRMPRLEVTVEDIGGQLEKTVGAVPLGKWQKIVTFLLGATGLLHGPHLKGRFQEEGSELVLTVELSGGGGRGSWRMSQDELPAEEKNRSETPGTEAPESALASRMVRQMAYRIAANLASLGSPRWEAVRSFTDGLRAYRGVRLSVADRDRELRKAERCFRQALRYDRTFNQGHYNLGVVYSKLGEYEAALSTFRQAIAADPSSFSAHLAVAMAYFDRAVDRFYRGHAREAVAEDFLQSRVFAGRAIALAPSEPRPWNVYGAATICWAWKGLAPPADTDPKTWDDEACQALDAFRVTAALSRRKLCRAELAVDRPAIEEARLVTLISLENLAEIELERGRPASSVGALREALRLAARKPSLHLALGKALACSPPGPDGPEARLVEAENELYDVHADGLSLYERAGRWAWLLAVHRELLRHATARIRGSVPGSEARASAERRRQLVGIDRAWRAALDSAAPPEDLLMEIPPEAEDRDPSGRASRYRKQVELLRHELRRFGPRTPFFRRNGKEAPAVWSALDRRLAALVRTEQGADAAASKRPSRCGSWSQAQSKIRKAREVLSANPGKAALLLGGALGHLQRKHYRQIRDQGLYALLAHAYLRFSKELRPSRRRRKTPWAVRLPAKGHLPKDRATCLHLALDYALRGVAEKPESALRHELLAEIYGALEDYRMADAERTAALELGAPVDRLGDAETLKALYTMWAARIERAGPSKEPLGEAIELFDHLRELLESAAVAPPDPTGKPRELRSAEHAQIHYYLGKLQQTDAARLAEAEANLAIARANGYLAAENGTKRRRSTRTR